ncbi:MAG: (2Fe-2S)-binding protein [Gammaproteobacteria bacterium]|nr:(2Fe-2S)-binding protein [Gammaproteobacteria bacterium]
MSEKSRTFRLNGKSIDFNPGDTVMAAAMRADVYIPHLCYHPQYKPHGSCRLCVVEINGRFVSSCTLPASEDLVVDSESAQLGEYRKSLLQMLFVEGNHVCPGCEKSGNCQLQALAYRENMLSPHFTHFFPKRPVDASHHEVALDFDRCILCELCVRASRDTDGKNLFSIGGRGAKNHLQINSATGKLGDTDFSIDDAAAKVCPVGVFLPKHKGYNLPIGKRLYDEQPIDTVGDANRKSVEVAGDE